MSMPTWISKLNNGQLDMMWNFLRFRPGRPSVEDVETLEKHLDDLRVMMIQKADGKREGKTKGALDFDDMGTTLNCIIIEIMGIYLDGGLRMLKVVLEDEE